MHTLYRVVHSGLYLLEHVVRKLQGPSTHYKIGNNWLLLTNPSDAHLSNKGFTIFDTLIETSYSWTTHSRSYIPNNALHAIHISTSCWHIINAEFAGWHQKVERAVPHCDALCSSFLGVCCGTPLHGLHSSEVWQSVNGLGRVILGHNDVVDWKSIKSKSNIISNR